MDSLSRLVRMLEPSGRVDLRCHYAGRWTLQREAAPPGQMPYHVILKGGLRVRLGRSEIELAEGDVVLLPHGGAHTLLSLRGGEESALSRLQQRHNGVVTEMSIPGSGGALDMMCGVFELGGPGGPLLRSLPQALRVRVAERADCAWLGAVIAMMRRETEQAHPGGVAVVSELSTALFALLLRALMTQQDLPQGLLALLGDERLAPAVEAVLREPAAEWTVAALAQQCNLSRAAFARHFTQRSGMTPLELVTGLRMQLAARLLRQDRFSTSHVAQQCGYDSDAAFGRVFKEHYGVGPGAYRLTGRESGMGNRES